MKLWDILRSWNLLYRKQVLKTTWKLRVFLLFLLIVFVLATGRFWLLLMSESLVHEDQMAPSDVILVESWETLSWQVYPTLPRCSMTAMPDTPSSFG